MSTTNLAEIHTQTDLAERRRHPRVKAAVRVELRPQGSDSTLEVEAADVGLGGCYIPMIFTLEVGRRLDLVLALGHHRLAIRAVVVRRDPQRGNGIMFLDMAREDRIRLQHFLKSNLETPGTTPASIV